MDRLYIPFIVFRLSSGTTKQTQGLSKMPTQGEIKKWIEEKASQQLKDEFHAGTLTWETFVVSYDPDNSFYLI